MSEIFRVSGKKIELKPSEGWRFTRRPGGWIIAENGAERVRLSIAEVRGKLSASVAGVLWHGEILQQGRGGATSSGGEADLTAQFPGKVRKILVKEGALVKEGEPLVLVEAMKMEFSVKAPYDGRIKRVLVQEGQQLSLPGRSSWRWKVAEIKIFEVGPRDGLQNEARTLSLDVKSEFVKGLIAAGIREMELGAFVRPDRVPQMADTDRLLGRIDCGKLKLGRARAWSLVPNVRGLERAIAAGAKNIAVFTAATESFTRRNIGMSIRESLDVFSDVIREARRHKMGVRGYVSTAFGCPFEGKVAPKKALRVIEKLGELGVDELSIGDTIGVADPRSVEAVLKPALKILGARRTAAHLHDTRGTALANALRAMDLGVRTIDSSAGGLGGCPFAPGAAGNLATEDLVYMLDGMGVRTGIRLDRLSRTSLRILKKLGRTIPPSRYLQAYSSTHLV